MSTPGVILWWEKRRWLYNGLVGSAGIVAIVVLGLFSAVTGSDCGLPDPPLALVVFAVAYGVAANVFYTIGCLAELVARATALASNSRDLGVAAFTLGTAGSVVVTLAPAILIPSLCTVERISSGHW